jgi:hypothetical protein
VVVVCPKPDEAGADVAAVDDPNPNPEEDCVVVDTPNATVEDDPNVSGANDAGVSVPPNVVLFVAIVEKFVLADEAMPSPNPLVFGPLPKAVLGAGLPNPEAAGELPNPVLD